MVTEYSDDFFEFYGKVMADRERYKNDRAVLDNQPMDIHHAVADGFHLSSFFNEVQDMINTFG